MEQLNDGHVIELAQIYYDKLREMLSPEQVQQSKERQRMLPASVSALHEVCDPAPVMRAALEAMFPGKMDSDDDSQAILRLAEVARPLGEMFLYQLAGFDHGSQESGETDTRYAGIVKVQDPDSGRPVHMQVHKDDASGVMFAVDASYLEANRSTIRSPFNPGRLVLQTAPVDADKASPNLDVQSGESSSTAQAHRPDAAHFDNEEVVEALLKIADQYGADEGQDAQAAFMDGVFVRVLGELALDKRAEFLRHPRVQEIVEIAGGEDVAQEILTATENMDGYALSSALTLLAEIPLQHALDTGEADHEIGDWQEFIRVGWEIATPVQRANILGSDALNDLLEPAGVELYQSPSQVENWPEIADFYGIDTSFNYSDRAIVEFANMYVLEPFGKANYACCEGWGHIFAASEVPTRWVVDLDSDEMIHAQALDGMGRWQPLDAASIADLMESVRDNDALNEPESFNVELLRDLPEWAQEPQEETQYPRDRGN